MFLINDHVSIYQSSLGLSVRGCFKKFHLAPDLGPETSILALPYAFEGTWIWIRKRPVLKTLQNARRARIQAFIYTSLSFTYVSQIARIKDKMGKDGRVKITWFYRPEEAVGGRKVRSRVIAFPSISVNLSTQPNPESDLSYLGKRAMERQFDLKTVQNSYKQSIQDFD